MTQLIKYLIMPKINLKEKYGSWAVVTGCTDGIGKAFSYELAKRGLNIVLISRNKEKLERVSNDIKNDYKIDTKIIMCDFTKGRCIYDDVKLLIDDLDVGILINNVGIQYSHPMYFGELPDDEIWNVLNVNLGSVVQMTKIILSKMLDKKKGAIVNLSSGSKLQPLPFMNLYAASKIFVDFFTDALREEYKNSNLTIQCLCPYYVTTKINHFNDRLLKNNLFVPTPSRYVKSALDTLGIIDNTTGYWPHRLQYLFAVMCPVWIKTYVGGIMYKSMRNNYLKKKSDSQ